MLETSALETLNGGQFTYKDRFTDTDTYNTLRHTGLHLNVLCKYNNILQ